MEVRVPEVFTKYISSFSGCMGGNPGAPIWMCIDHSCRTPDVIAPSFFDTPVEDISGFAKGPSCLLPGFILYCGFGKRYRWSTG